MLFHNEIAPGQKISYRDLAERLGMSQPPVIQALKWPEFQNLARHERNRGYYTASVSLREVESEFHLTLANLSECQVRLRTLKNLFDLLYLKYGGNILLITSMNTAYTDHLALYDLLVARDLRGAKRAFPVTLNG